MYDLEWRRRVRSDAAKLVRDLREIRNAQPYMWDPAALAELDSVIDCVANATETLDDALGGGEE